MAGQEAEGQESNVLQVTEFISASELASLMNVSPTEVVAKCFGLGLMVSINQRLDAEVIELVAGEFGYTVEFIDMEKQLAMEEEEEAEEDEIVSEGYAEQVESNVTNEAKEEELQDEPTPVDRRRRSISESILGRFKTFFENDDALN